MLKIKNIEWSQVGHQSSSNNIDRFLGRINNVLFFEIYKFKNDDYVMSIKIPGTKDTIIINESLEYLQQLAQDEIDSFFNGLIDDSKAVLPDIYVFLDIDGVVATERALDKKWFDYAADMPMTGFGDDLKSKKLAHPPVSMYDWPFDQECISNLHYYQRYYRTKGYNVNYVISSSWRMGRTIEELNKLFAKKGLILHEIVGKTKHGKTRGEEINEWLKDNNVESNPFIVIDDECDYDIVQHIDDKHLVKTIMYNGFDTLKLKNALYKTNDLLSL